MDLLGSILNSMEKPPTTSVKKQQDLLAKKNEEKIKKIQEEEKSRLRRFRDKIEGKVKVFVENDEQQKLEFEPMNKMERTIIHEVAEVAGLTAFSFGIEDVDRHIILYRKESVPCEDELNALRKGEEWDPEKAKLQKQMQQEAELEARQKKEEVIPNSNYREKYEKLIGKDAGKTAAQVTKPNKQFGFVPSENKRDLRSIEQILADSRRKKQKTDNETKE